MINLTFNVQNMILTVFVVPFFPLTGIVEGVVSSQLGPVECPLRHDVSAGEQSG